MDRGTDTPSYRVAMSTNKSYTSHLICVICQAKLVVTGLPFCNTENPEQIVEGSNVTFTCGVTTLGGPKPELSWVFRNSKILGHTHNYGNYTFNQACFSVFFHRLLFLSSFHVFKHRHHFQFLWISLWRVCSYSHNEILHSIISWTL